MTSSHARPLGELIRETAASDPLFAEGVRRAQTQFIRSLVPQVIARMTELRKARKWSALHLSRELAAVGVDLPRTIIANLENGRRQAITVDELAGLGAVFGVEPWSLTSPDMRCPHCWDSPPPGFSCNVCGNVGSVAATAAKPE